MDLGLQGRVALVCAASKGIGRAVAIGLAQERAKVAVCARGEQALQETAAEIKDFGAEVLPIQADVTVAEDCHRLVERTVAHFGRLDVLVNNAGGPSSGTFFDFSDEDFHKALELSLFSALRLTREAVPHMRQQGGGRIVNLVSMSVKQPMKGLILSNTARTGLIGLAKSLANELAPDHILVNNVCPGWTSTERVRGLAETRAAREGKSYEAVVAEITAEIPLGRMGRTDEVAAIAIFLASDRASYITGTTISVDGGIVKGLF